MDSGYWTGQVIEVKIPMPILIDLRKFETLALDIYSKKKKLLDSKNKLQKLFNSLIQKVFKGELNPNIDIELDSLVRAIDLEKKQNDLSIISGNDDYLKRLVNKLNAQEFQEKEMYDKAKHAVFQLLKEGKKIAQEYNNDELLLVLK